MVRSIQSSVGSGGTNSANDTTTIQEMLNLVPTPSGGASPRLRVDGIVGTNTLRAIGRFQRMGADFRWPDHRVDPGQRTINRLNEILDRQPTIPLPYYVPGMKDVIAQPSSMSCWATVYTMMVSWKDQSCYAIRDAVARVGARYAQIYDANTGLPSSEFGPFLHAARMRHEPMMNLPIAGWLQLLRTHGLLWVGTLAGISPTSGLHSRIIEGMHGDGTPLGTFMDIIDPAGGRQYQERFSIFVMKYEGAIRGIGGQYFQIRHF